MQLNQFIWDNYKQTEKGAESIKLFTDCDLRNVLSKFSNQLPYDFEDSLDLVENLVLFCKESEMPEISSDIEAANFINSLLRKGITLTYENGDVEIFNHEDFDFLYLTPIISTWLYKIYPQFFKPYFLFVSSHY